MLKRTAGRSVCSPVPDLGWERVQGVCPGTGLRRLLLPAALCAAAASFAHACAHAQTPVQSTTGPTRPQPLPLSGNTLPADPVTVLPQVSPSNAPGDVNVLNSTVTVQGPYAGSRPEGKLSPETLQLSLETALRMALRNNLGQVSQEASVQQTQAQRAIARSALLPSLNIGAAEVFAKQNLRTVGLKSDLLPASTIFNYDDLRGVLQQSVFDMVSIRELQGAGEAVKSSIANARNARDLIVLAAGGSYLQLVAGRARVQAGKAQEESARAVYQRAFDQYSAGLAAKLDATRAEVQWQTERQRTVAYEAEVETQALRLARIVGLPSGQKFVASDTYGFQPETDFTLETALARAMTHRQDLVAAASGVKAADLSVKAARSERLPSVSVHADAGVAGTTPTNTSLGVYTVQGIAKIPVYNGGRVSADVRQAEAAQAERRAELENARSQVDQDVRQAFIQLNAAEQQVRLATNNQQLAHESLTQSADRFAAGVTDTVEVVQAEQAVVQADDDLITALFQHNLAKLMLARSMGAAEETLPQLLRK